MLIGESKREMSSQVEIILVRHGDIAV